MLASHSSVDIWLGQHWKSACGKSETWVTVAGENCVWAKKEKTAVTTTKRRCLGPRAERNPGSCANPFCLWGDFWENVAIESVFLSVYRIPGRRWHFVKKFSDSWPPHLQNLRTVIDKQAYKHGVNFLFFVTHWKGFSLWKRRYLADLCDCRSCSTSMKPCIRQRSAWKAIQLSYYVSLGHCSPELKNHLRYYSDQKIRLHPLFHRVRQKKNSAEMDLRDRTGLGR